MSNENNNITTTAPDVADMQERNYKQQADDIINRAISNRRPLSFLDFKAISALNRAIKDLSAPSTRNYEKELAEAKKREEGAIRINSIREAMAIGKAMYEERKAKEAAGKTDTPADPT